MKALLVASPADHGAWIPGLFNTYFHEKNDSI